MHFQTSFNPARLLALSFLVVISVGTLLLNLPFATTRGISFIDSLYTATSAVCVTGLVVKDTENDFTLFGKLVILLLIQIGGLGYMTISTIVVLMFREKVSLETRLTVKGQMGILTLGNFRLFLFDVLKILLLFEIVGSFLLFGNFLHFGFPWKAALFHSVFHSVSAFCNAGFSSFSTNLSAFSRSIFLPLLVAILFISGGLGFPVWSEIKRTKGKRKISRLSLHTRTVLKMTFLLILLGTILFIILEYNNSLRGYPFLNKVLISFFHGVTPRTAGFNLITVGNLFPPTLLLLIILMFIGASPGGTGGGIKTTTFAVMLAHLRSTVKQEKETNLFKRRLPAAVISRAFTLAFLSIIWITIITLILLYTEKKELIKILFEVVSAFGTVGLSTGITPTLTTVGKILIIATMFLGRIGPLTLGMSLIPRFKISHFKYPEEEVLVG